MFLRSVKIEIYLKLIQSMISTVFLFSKKEKEQNFLGLVL